MHIMEGFLPLQWCIFWFLMALPFLIWGVYKVRKIFREHPEKKLMIAISGAFIFVLSSLKLPSVTGSSSHPTGTGVGTVLYGVGVTAVLALIVLIFQALLLAHGGITTLGANVFSMGIAGPIAAFIAFKGLQRLHVRMSISVFIAAFLADIITYVVTAMQLALAFPSNGSVMASFWVFFGIYSITQIPLAIAEGILTVMFFDFLAESRPELLAESIRVTKSKLSKKARYAIASVTVAAVVIAMAVVRVIGLEGSDDAGSNTIIKIDPNYVRWATPFFELSQTEEILLFAVQSLIGLAIIYYVYRRWKRQKEDAEDEDEPSIADDTELTS